MDNQLFPGGGAFLDDVAQVCTLCGMMFNNTLTYQHHMQLHILSANAQMLGTQPPPDPGIGMPTAASILDLIGGVSQHALSTCSGVPLVPPQAVFSGAAASTMPPHLISPGVGLVTGSLPNIGLPQQQIGRVKEKKQKSTSTKTATSTSCNSTTSSSSVQRSSGSGSFKSRENSTTYISTFPKDLQKIEHLSPKPKQQNAQQSQAKSSSDVFTSSTSQVDPLEALILTSPVKQVVPGFERQLSRKSAGSPQDSLTISKDSKKLFQPFVSVDTPISSVFVTKSNSQFNADSLLSPVKTGTGKTILHDVLSTPQKISYHNSNENLFTSPSALPATSGGDIRNFGMFQDSEMASLPVDLKSDLPSKISSQDDKLSLKSQYFPEIMDPLNISPKAGQSVRKKDTDPMIKMPVHQGSLDHSRSSSPVTRQTLPDDFVPFRGDSARPLVSPKVSPALPSSNLDSDSTSLSSKPHLFGSAATDILPSTSVASSAPQVFGSSVLANPAMDIAVNPLGTGYFNALTQKFIDPTFSLGADFSKPNLSAASGGQDGQKQKIYFENGVIMNQDYDKISDTNDEDNLERLIDDIDTKSDNIVDKGYSEIEDLLNEFNEKQLEDMKNKSQIDDFMKNDDFLKNVIEDPSKSKTDNSLKVDDSTFNPPEEFEMNRSIISDILEQEKERIDKESTELENARLSGLMNSSATTSTSVTVSSATITSTVTSASSSEPKVSTSTGSGEKKEDDHVDFEIPKVGKLMKIRKYFQIQEQKRKEQTEKVTEVRVHEKNEAPPSEEKPQTILVQVSKRKKIEYGPYLNRQSLLEGKPKANIDSTSPPKTYRPKPKPPVPEKRTFNLRERKTKTDFATLATTGSRTAETKKTETKQKPNESTEKVSNEKEDLEESKERKVENKTEGTELQDTKIVTRNQDKKKEVDSDSEKTRSKSSKGGIKSSNETEKEKGIEQDTKQKDLKAALRTRSARNETESADGKNLRKRTIKSVTAGDETCSKVKVKKADESLQKASSESEEKVTRSKSKLKATPDKTGIKKCSVNLGEKYNESKSKCQLQTSDIRTDISAINEKETKGDNKTEVTEMTLKSDESTTGEAEKQKCLKDSDVKDSEPSSAKVDKDLNSFPEDNKTLEKKLLECSENDYSKGESDKLKDGSNIFQKISRKGSKTRSNRRESNIFDKIDQPECTEKQYKPDESQMVSITSTDNTDKKVTMKLKLGPNFQKAFEMFSAKKRKHDSIGESEHSLEKEPKKEQKSEKKLKDAAENEFMKDSPRSAKLEESCQDDIVKESKSENENNTEKVRTPTVADSSRSEIGLPDISSVKETAIQQTSMEVDLENDLKASTDIENIASPKSEQDLKQSNDMEVSKDFNEDKLEKKVKHSVENEFQRLVNEAMAEAQKEGDAAKSKNLRKRLNENVKYNVDESDDELDKLKLLPEDIMNSSKSQKGTPKGLKNVAKGAAVKPKSKLEFSGMKDNDSMKPKKDVDVYDFTDTEMSDSEESTTKKLGFKPKYVSNLNLFGQKKIPFVSKPMSPFDNSKSESQPESFSESAPKEDTENEDASSGISYVGKTVEPLKIKLSKIIPFKEKKHKHKKKKRKREKERRENDLERFDSESRDSVESGGNKLPEDVQKAENGSELETSETKKIEEVRSVDSIGQESNSNSNEGDDDQNETGSNAKSSKRAKLKEKKHICEYCNVGFGQKCDLRRHVMIHTGERPYPCQICDKRFQRKTDLVKHTRTHTGEKPYACEFCDKRVSDKSQLNVHRRLHTGDRPYCCSKCGKRCITSSELSRHKAVHCGEKVERCSLCKKAFTVKECLGMHMKLHYRSRGKSFKCEKCAIGFDKKADLDSHHCVDPMKNVYVCSECYEEFGDEMLYAEHIKTHDLGVLACNVCTNIFEDKHSLETHLCSLGMEKQKQLTCDICDMEFQEQEMLNQHVRIHDSDEGSFMCDLCSEIFSVRKKFIEHSKQHELGTGKLPGSCPGSATSTGSSQISETSPSLNQFASKINELSFCANTEKAAIPMVKQEVDCESFDFLGSNNENLANVKGNSLGVKTEFDAMNAGLPSNRSRASVISGTFRIDDESGDSRHSNVQEKVAVSRGNLNIENLVTLTGKGPFNRTSSNLRSPDFLASDRFFEPADFSNSPDFSTLTEGDDLDLSPFGDMSEPLKKDNEKSVKMSQSMCAKQIDRSASLDLKQKIMKQFSTSSQSCGAIPASGSGLPTSHGLIRQSSASSLQMQNSQISALLSSETTTTHSSNSSQITRGQLHRAASAGQTSPFSNSQNNHGNSYPLNSQNKRWSGFQMSAADFVNSFLGETKADTLAFESKPYNAKASPFTQSLSKGATSTVGIENRNDVFNKDNIENQIKSELFSEFDISTNNQKPSTSLAAGSFKQSVQPQNRFGNTSSGAFHGINPSSFSPQQFPQNFSEKSDFSAFGQQFVGPFSQTSPYSSSVSNNSLKANVAPDYSLDSSVTPDVNKRHLQGIYGGRSDTIQNTSFYLSGVDDPMKDLTGSDKDETTALLSNFDQF